MARINVVKLVRPHRSAMNPPAQEPTGPVAITKNVIVDARCRGSRPEATRWSPKKIRNQAAIANSSHM